MNTKDVPAKRLSARAGERIVDALSAAEQRTSAELRVHVEARVPGDPLAAARGLFARLGMTKTRERNAVLLYVSLADRKCAIWADQGAHERLGDAFWDEVCRVLSSRSKDEGVETGIIDAVTLLGHRLSEVFPRRPDDVNELPDDLSTSGGDSDSRT